MKLRKTVAVGLLVAALSLSAAACSSVAQAAQSADAQDQDATSSQAGTVQVSANDPEVDHPDNWNEASHGNSAEPDYETVFPQDEVNRLDITISPENWQAMLDDMTELYGQQGTGNGMGGGRPDDGRAAPNQGDQGGQVPPDDGQALPERNPGAGRGQGGGFGGGMMGAESDDNNPIWVTATIEFEGEVWSYVGIRFKGNSSLRQSWSSGSLKFPLKLDFDEFEDQYPEIDDQRFFGFKQLTLSSNFSDSSQLREKVTADIFREAGIAAPYTAFYEVYLDYGEGPVYLGLYTMVEVVDDTVIQTQFDDDSGNVYKPSGAGASFAAGTFDEVYFDKETNSDEGDWSDIEALFEALHSDLRTTDPAAWRAGLEAVFDVDTFIHWLAVNTLVQNWDTYGVMSHNYYLYNDPSTGQLTWIPWDNNMALSSSMGMSRVLPLDMASVDNDWPLIRFLMDDPVYHQMYVDYIEDTINGAFEPARMAQIFQEYHDLVAPYVGDATASASGGGMSVSRASGNFATSVEQLIAHVNSRYQAAMAYLDSQQ